MVSSLKSKKGACCSSDERRDSLDACSMSSARSRTQNFELTPQRRWCSSETPWLSRWRPPFSFIDAMPCPLPISPSGTPLLPVPAVRSRPWAAGISRFQNPFSPTAQTSSHRLFPTSAASGLARLGAMKKSTGNGSSSAGTGCVVVAVLLLFVSREVQGWGNDRSTYP